MYSAVILVVDDEQTYLESITEILQYKNYKIVHALNGKMGITNTQKFSPDIIITDWEMPEMNGIQMITELKKNDETKDIPIIMCTGIMLSAENLNTALEAGAVDYIRKPVDEIEIVARINSAIKLSESFKKIKKQNDELQLLIHTKDKFFSIIAHDLRGPIGNLDTYLDFLIENIHSRTKDELLELFFLLKNSTTQTFNLLENILTWARSQRNEIPYFPAMLDLQLVIEESIAVFQLHADNKDIKIINNVDDKITCFFDDSMIRTVLRNLLNNAIKYTPQKGTIEIFINPLENYTEVSITDSGIGMSKTTLDKLFRIDSKLQSMEGTRGERGTGLGLILCKEFIDRHKGEIWAESIKEKGTKITFTLPNSENTFDSESKANVFTSF